MKLSKEEIRILKNALKENRGHNCDRCSLSYSNNPSGEGCMDFLTRVIPQYIDRFGFYSCKRRLESVKKALKDYNHRKIAKI
jgi:hypothetical protein